MAKLKRKLPWWVKLMRYFARAIVIAWTLFWGAFVWLQIIFEGATGPPWWVVLMFSAFTAVTLAGIILLWFLEFIGSIVLFAEGLCIFFLLILSANDVPEISDAPLALLIIGPPLVGGLLSFLSWWFSRKAPLDV